MTDGPKYQAVTTPAGVAVFPWLSKADTEHVKTGLYHVDLSVPFAEADKLIAKLERIRDDFIATLPVAKQKALIVKPVFIEELTRPEYPEGASKEEKAAIRAEWNGEPTGNVLFRWKMKAQVQPQDGEAFTQKPIIVSADTGEAIEQPVYDGSIIKVKGQVVPYTNAASGIVGVTLRLKAVQVIDLVTGSGSGSAYWTEFDEDDE